MQQACSLTRRSRPRLSGACGLAGAREGMEEMRAAGVQADEVTCNTLREASVVSDIATRSTSPQVMGDEAELGPTLKGSVSTLDSVENWLLFESCRGTVRKF